MIFKLLRNMSFQSLLTKIIVVYLVYVLGFSVLNIFTFTKDFPSQAKMAIDIALLSFIFDQVIYILLRRYINIFVSLKNIKTGENMTIFYRDQNILQKVMLTISIKSKSKYILNIIKKIIGKDKVVLKLKWAHDTWLSFQRVNGILTMNQDSMFYAETDGLCVNLFDPLQLNEVAAEIIDTPLLITCDMGDKTEGEILEEVNIITNNKIKHFLLNLMIRLWVDVFYVPHKIKVV